MAPCSSYSVLRTRLDPNKHAIRRNGGHSLQGALVSWIQWDGPIIE